MARWCPEATVIHTVINAREIRFELSGADLPKVLAAPKRVTRPPGPRQPHVAAVRPNAGQLQLEQAEAQRKAAQTLPVGQSSRFISSLYALRAPVQKTLKLCHHMALSWAHWQGHLGLYWLFVLDCALLAPGHAQVPRPGARVGYAQHLGRSRPRKPLPSEL
jgi:hypothetical protein